MDRAERRKEIGKDIRCVRVRLGLTQEQLAKKTGTTAAMISQYESGKTAPPTDKYQEIMALNS